MNNAKKNQSIVITLDINRVIHEPARLTILGLLSVLENADFLFIMNQTGMTKGNLSSHLSKLEESGYIIVSKEFVKKKTHTILSISVDGALALADYLATIRKFLAQFPG